MKTEEQLAKIEEEKLRKLEVWVSIKYCIKCFVLYFAISMAKIARRIFTTEEHFLVLLKSERVRRMKGLPREEMKPTHISADDLVDW